MSLPKRAAAILFACALCACGGGGSASVAADTADAADQPAIALLAGSIAETGTRDGAAFDARLSSLVMQDDNVSPLVRIIGGPRLLAGDAAGDLFFVDGPASPVYGSDLQVVRQVTPTGTVRTLSLVQWPPVHGMVPMSTPLGVACTYDGSILYSLQGSGVYRQSPPTAAPEAFYLAPGSSATQSPSIYGWMVTTDADGNVFVFTGPYDGQVFRVSPQGNAQLFAVLPGGVGATAMATAANGDLYMLVTSKPVDAGRGLEGAFVSRILKYSRDGVLSAVAGAPTGTGYADGPAASALFDQPQGMAVAADGTVYVADTMNQVIRKVDTGGTVTTVAGVPGKNGVVFGPLPGGLSFPTGVALLAPRTLAVTTSSAVVKITLP